MSGAVRRHRLRAGALTGADPIGSEEVSSGGLYCNQLW